MYDVIVIGAGPSGLMASIKAASNNKKVLLIEKNNKIGKKLLLTGGGRCNLTNLKSIKSFIDEIPVNSKMLYSTLNNFGPQDIYNYFESLGVKLKIEDNNRVFPIGNDAHLIINAFQKQLEKYKIEVIYNTEVINIILNEDCKNVITNQESYKTKNIVIATGGNSYSQTGSDGSGYKLAKMLNQPLTELYPVDTFLITEDKLPLAGITLDEVIIEINNKEVNGSILFTHNGLSGPATFKISEYVYHELKKESKVVVKIKLLPNYSKEELMIKINQYESYKEIKTFVKELIPNRLADYILEYCLIDGSKKIASVSNKDKQNLVSNIIELPINIVKTGTIEQSLVTGGGIDLKYINTKTMESTINKGIYFVGELLDFHGPTGGYNITIALSTGYTAGSNV